jgi:hypothetical protein
MTLVFLEELLRSGPRGVAAGCLPFTGLVSLGLLPFALRRGARVVTVPVALNLGLAVGSVVLACALLEHARGVAVNLLLEPGRGDPSVWARDVAWAVALWLNTLLAAGFTWLVVVPSSMAGLGCRWLRAERQRGLSSTVPLVPVGTPALGFVVSAVAVIRLHRAGISGWGECEFYSVEENIRCRYQWMLAMFDVLGTARWGVLAVGMAAMAAALLVVILRRSAPRPVSRGARYAAIASLGIGVVAFVATRAVAADSRHPLPLWLADIEWPMAKSLPLANNDGVAAGDVSPVVHIDRKTTLDGVPFDDPGELTRDLAGKLELRKRLWSGREPPGIVVFAVAPQTPMARVAPLVPAARAAGYRTVAVAKSLPRRTFETRTLGTVTYRPRVCALRYPLDGLWPTEGSWDDFARTLSSSSCASGSR